MAELTIEAKGQSSGSQEDGLGQPSGSQHGLGGQMLNDFDPYEIKVLAIDANVVSLEVLVAHLKKCQYQVTSTTMASEALKILRGNKQTYDLVITDVLRPDMDGFKLLEIIGLEMDIPVIMVSADEDKGSILKAIKHGARDYLIKPVRLQEIRNIWQHVVRKRQLESCDRSSITRDVTEPPGGLVAKREEGDDEGIKSGQRKDGLLRNGRRRIQWTTELHSKFVDVIEMLEAQNEKIHPKRILEIMNVEGLTRENIASHLQKYRVRTMLNRRDEEKSEQTYTPRTNAQDSHLYVNPTGSTRANHVAYDREKWVSALEPSGYGQYQPTVPPRSLYDIRPGMNWARPIIFGSSSSPSSFPSQIPLTTNSFASTAGSTIDNYRVASSSIGSLVHQECGFSPYMHHFPTNFVSHNNVPLSVNRPATNYYSLPSVTGPGQNLFSGQDNYSARSMPAGVVSHYPLPLVDQDDQTKPLADEDIMEMLNQFYSDGPPRL